MKAILTYLPLMFWLLLAGLICLPGWYYAVPGSGWLAGEWLLLGLLLLGWKPRTGWRWGLALFFGLLMFLALYGLFSWRLYRVSPNLYHDWSLLTEVLPIFWSELSLGKLTAYLPLLLGVVLGPLLLVWLTGCVLKALRKAQIPQKTSRILILAGLALLLILSLSGQVQWLSRQVYTNWQDSRQLYADVHAPVDTSVLRNDWTDSLRYQPDIYLIFLESYGKVLATDSAMRGDYAALLAREEATLSAAGWGMRSAWSEAPISGGRSWLGFTTFLTGKRLYAHPQYTRLLSEYPDYPHLVRFLNDHGYYTLRMNTLKAETQSARIPYALYDRFFAFDRWLRYEDFPYSGPAYGKFGNLPDQYALGYAREEVIGQRHPFFMFFITLNSHSPWNDVPLLTNDWRSLAALPDTAQSGQESSLMEGLAQDKYWKAMDYELRMMSQFVAQQGDSNSLFIFLGDHQPPFLTGAADDFATPVHVMSRNDALLAAFTARGFEAGLLPTATASVGLKHEDFYGLLRAVLRGE